MIQFNLLPDVKIAFIKAQRQKRIVITVSTIATAAAVGLFLILFITANVVQKKSIDDLTKDINTTSSDLTGTTDINKILTIQNQLKTLEELHGQKVVSTRLFNYMQQVTPGQVSISSLTIDFATNGLTISGKAPSLLAANTYADSLKFTTFTTPSSGDTKNPAFSNVVLGSFALGDESATYTFALNFDQALFTQAEEAKLEVPKIISTRSSTELPGNALFQENREDQ